MTRSAQKRGLLELWVPIVLVTTFIAGLIYITVQQNYRQTANDPQIQLAEDTASRLANGQDPKTLIASQKTVDIANSLAPYLIIYDNGGNVVSSSAELGDQTPKLPKGVLHDATVQELHFTWQPAPGVRSAAVVTRYSGINSGYVLAGRSLREVEKRESQLETQVAIGWMATLLGSLLLIIIF